MCVTYLVMVKQVMSFVFFLSEKFMLKGPLAICEFQVFVYLQVKLGFFYHFNKNIYLFI